jgi:hypothetical protein
MQVANTLVVVLDGWFTDAGSLQAVAMLTRLQQILYLFNDHDCAKLVANTN